MGLTGMNLTVKFALLLLVHLKKVEAQESELKHSLTVYNSIKSNFKLFFILCLCNNNESICRRAYLKSVNSAFLSQLWKIQLCWSMWGIHFRHALFTYYSSLM